MCTVFTGNSNLIVYDVVFFEMYVKAKNEENPAQIMIYLCTYFLTKFCDIVEELEKYMLHRRSLCKYFLKVCRITSVLVLIYSNWHFEEQIRVFFTRSQTSFSNAMRKPIIIFLLCFSY